MPTLYNADLKPLAPGTPTHSYDHASKLFVTDNFRLAPKQSFLYYVCINVDSDILQNILNGIINTNNAVEPVSSETLIEQYEAGLMAKRVDLPKFTLNTKTMNAYNRKNIVQTHISYDPITIVFHDDTADVVTRFWNDYYTYYYRDSDYQTGTYLAKHKYQPRLREKWGYSPRNGNLKAFLRNIQIYSLHNKRFTEYTLVNPFITSWRHGEHNSYGDTGILENTMTLSYETVKYRTGYINAVDVNGFALLHYDNVQSPISTSTTNIYTQAGLVGAIAGGPTDLSRPDGYGAGSGIFSQILGAYQFYNNIKNANLSALAKQAIPQIGLGILNGALNSGNNSIFPTLGGFNGSGTATTALPNTNTYSANPYAVTTSISLGAAIIASAQGAAVNTAAGTLNQATSNWARGIQSSFNGPGVSPNSTAMYQAGNTSGYIAVNPQSGQVNTGTINAVILDDSGKQVQQFSSYGTQDGRYYSTNKELNVVAKQTTYDESNNPVQVWYYKDGSEVVFNQTGEQVAYVPGSLPYNQNINTTPINTRDLIASGQSINPAAPQLYTDPRTGVTYTVGNSTSALITNSLAGAAGGIGGLAVGTSLNQYLNNTVLGKSVLGQTVSGVVSGVAGMYTARAINNGLQPILNNFTNTISQGWDSATGSIKNVFTSWTNGGKWDPANPKDNIVSQLPDGEGGFIITDKTGGVSFTDGNLKVMSSIPGSNANFFSNWFNGSPGQNTDTAAANPPYGTVWTDGSGNPILAGNGTMVSTEGGVDPNLNNSADGPSDSVDVYYNGGEATA